MKNKIPKNVCMWCQKSHPEKQMNCPTMTKKYPLPKSKPKKERVLFQSLIDKELWMAVNSKRIKKGLTCRQVMEYGLQFFLSVTDD